MREFSVIPVLDLMGGQVVHGKAGARESYRPIESPFGPADDPVAIAKALCALTGMETLYIADLDAIEGKGDQAALCCALKRALPEIEIWLDGGFAAGEPVRRCLSEGLTPVIGSECLADMARWAAMCAAGGDGLVLSLDFDQAGFRGPDMLLAEPDLWPPRIVVMTLGAVGSAAGPDFARLADIVQKTRPGHVLYAAGGIRGTGDLEAVADAGTSGALIATALHRGTLSQKEIAVFRRRRRLLASNTAS